MAWPGPEGGQRHGGTGAPPGVEEGLEPAPGRRQQVNRCPKKPDGQGEPRLIAPACSGPPEGPAGWTLRLPADRFAQREAAGNISTVPVRRTLRERAEAPVPQRGRLRLRQRSRIPPQGNAEFVCDGVSRRTVSAIPAGRGIPGRESLTERVP